MGGSPPGRIDTDDLRGTHDANSLKCPRVADHSLGRETRKTASVTQSLSCQCISDRKNRDRRTIICSILACSCKPDAARKCGKTWEVVPFDTTWGKPRVEECPGGRSSHDETVPSRRKDTDPPRKTGTDPCRAWIEEGSNGRESAGVRPPGAAGEERWGVVVACTTRRGVVDRGARAGGSVTSRCFHLVSGLVSAPRRTFMNNSGSSAARARAWPSPGYCPSRPCISYGRRPRQRPTPHTRAARSGIAHPGRRT